MSGALRLVAHAGGWLVEDAGTPIGYIAGDGSVVTPSGARYSVSGGEMRATDGRPAATYRAEGPAVQDAASGVEWALRPDWRGAPGATELDLGEAFAQAYTLEDAQGTMPARVKLLLAHIMALGGE